MNRFEGVTKLPRWSMALLLAALLAGCGDGNLDPILGGSPGASGAGTAVDTGAVNLGAAATFGIAATAGVTNTNTAPLTHIEGNVILANPTPTCNGVAAPGGVGSAGFGTCGATTPTSIPVLIGTVVTPTYPDTTTATAVKADMNTAFLSICAPGLPAAACSLVGATNLSAGTTLGDVAGNPYVQGDNYFVPGIYQSTTSIMITGDLTLDAQGDSNADFYFQSSSTIGMAAGAAPPGVRSRILLINGARASHVYWQASSDVTLGLYSEFQGNILAARNITMLTGATSCGRIYAGAWSGGTGGAFVFDSNVVSVPGRPFAPPATYSTTCQ